MYTSLDPPLHPPVDPPLDPPSTRPAIDSSCDPTFDTRSWMRWLAGFIGFPLAGLAARAVAGPIDSLAAAVVGGLAGGAALGAVQAMARRARRSDRFRWMVATAVGLGVGLGVGSGAVGYETDTASLMLMGALSGVGVGMAQSAVLDSTRRRRALWAAMTPMLWALGWLITSQVIVDADRQHATFGASGALVVTAISGAVLALGAREPELR